MKSFLLNSDEEAAAQEWLSATGCSQIVPFGGISDPKPFWDRFKAEFRKFICDETAYSDVKSSFAKEAPISKAVIISAVSGAIGATIGYAATLLAPAVALLLYAVAKMGVQAYCAVG
ncbi:hypothetical protein [Pseudoxanthomonas sp. LH2527]|uniref:hypothetical protein n=1 Tax=Pseudoxanthomonas sp. LH2527 TaxID=2923249 RepID=UPI001F1455A5|nr:hypothetical protein [Pseudoxanthomonas sp. LH2527]